jgi:hypothetical protein
MFYKLIDDYLHSGPFVQMPDGFLHKDFLDTYTFPIDGWYYFETEQEAKDFFGITE